MGLFLFLIYVNDLSNGLKREYKLFPDDISSFSVSIYIPTLILLQVISTKKLCTSQQYSD